MLRVAKKQKGFTLMEMLVAITMFSIIMLAVMQIFASAFSGYRETKKLQRNLENAQFVLNTMAKELRTSSILSASSPAADIRFIDYSQNGGLGTCILYRASGGPLQKWARPMTDPDSNTNRTTCQGVVFSGADYQGVLIPSEHIIDSAVHVVQSDDSPKAVGRVTLRVKIGAEAYNEILQTTVSLRDFNYVGL